MRLAELVDALGLPPATRLNKRVFKKLFVDRGELGAADRRALTNAVGTVTWAFTLKPATLPIPPWRGEAHPCEEIAVLDVELTDRRQGARVAELVHRTIPYPVLLLLWDAQGACVSTGSKRQHLGVAGRVVVEAVDLTPWLDGEARSAAETAFLAGLALPGLPQVHLGALYEAWTQRVLSLQCAPFAGRFPVGTHLSPADRRAALEACHATEREVRGLRATLRAETSFARQVELNVRIKQLEAELARQTASL